MRLKITLEPEEKGMIVPYNYHYFLYKNFLRILNNSPIIKDVYNLKQKEYPINQNGYILDFAISSLKIIDKYNSTDDGIILNGNVTFNFSMPDIRENIKNKLVGYMLHKSFPIHYIKNKPNKFKIIKIKQPVYTYYSGLMYYKTLSPICLGNILLNDISKLNINQVEFIIDKLILNLKLKFLKVYNRYFDGELEIYFFTDIYSETEILGNYKELMVSTNRKKRRKVTLLNMPLAVNTSSEMQNVILKCGFGLYNYLGYGYVQPTEISKINL